MSLYVIIVFLSVKVLDVVVVEVEEREATRQQGVVHSTDLVVGQEQLLDPGVGCRVLGIEVLDRGVQVGDLVLLQVKGHAAVPGLIVPDARDHARESGHLPVRAVHLQSGVYK